MSADTASPSRGGVGVIGDRYRLVERITNDNTMTLWLAHDQLLARPVSLTVHNPGGDAATEFLGRAHRLSTVSHPALARVYDAVDEGYRAYVVSEWVDGTSLTDMLVEGPLDPNEAASMVGRLAEAVSQAHTAGNALGGLHPDFVRMTRRGVVFSRIAGNDAVTSDDIRGLGGLLYAALTAQWPLSYAGTGPQTKLRPATAVAGRLSAPRQVRGGVPHDLSTLSMRALQPEDPRGIRSAEAIATVLNDRARPAAAYDEPLPYVPNEAPPPANYGYAPHQPPAGGGYQYPPEPPRRHSQYEQPYEHYEQPYVDERRRSRVASISVVVAAVAALAIVGWVIGMVLGKVPDGDSGRAEAPLDLSNAPTSQSSQSSQGQPVGDVIRPASATLFDPQGDGQDNPSDVPQAIDGNPGTAWQTVHYKRSATFGNLKTGMGILVDMGKPVSVSQVRIHTTKPGMNLEVRAGDAPGGSLQAYQVVGKANNVKSQDQVSVTNGGEHQYWLIWVTKLVPSDGDFQGSLDEVVFNA